MVVLEVVRGPDAGRTFRLGGEAVTLGRSSRADVRLTDKEVSALHVRLAPDGEGWLLSDLESSNLTYVNGHRAREVPLHVGDEITIGQTTLRFRDGEAPPPEQAPPRPDADVGNRTTQAGLLPRAYRIRMGKQVIEAPLARRLLRRIICPSCWHAFPPDEMRFISRHPYLLGDPVMGRDEFKRFEPRRFSVAGEALDERGLPTTEIACPHCHIQLPEAALELFPLFISVVGPPASGKSYLLTTMTRELRHRLPAFALSFSDTDPVANTVVHDYERTLFLSPRPDEPTEIPKTQRDDPRLHKTALLDEVEVRFPVPFQFALAPTPDHPLHDRAHRLRRNVVLYDNAGEDFLPRTEEAGSAAALHLARSEILIVLFDPTQEPRFLPACRPDDPQLSAAPRPGSQQPFVQFSQETIMREVAVRVRRYLQLAQDQQYGKPLIIVVAKSDVLAEIDGVSLDTEPWAEADGAPAQLDVARIERASGALRELLRRHCPEFVATAESLSRIVRYIPVSSLGCSPVLVERDGQAFFGVRPRDIDPKWVTVPLLYCLCKWGAPGLVSPTGGRDG